MATLIYSPITVSDVQNLMPIENACHSHPWSEGVFTSCIGGRYFGEFASLPLLDEAESAESKDERKGIGQIIGFYVAEYLLGEATLMDICVDPSQQGQGFGNALLSQFIKEAESKGAEKIWLEVRASNTSALMLYINHGFIETGRRTGYYPKAVGFEDAIVMCKAIS